MEETTMNAVIAVARSASCVAAIVAAYLLADAGKEGWGWMVFLAVMLGAYSFKYTP